MWCWKCKYEFCWLCLKFWDDMHRCEARVESKNVSGHKRALER